MSKKQHSRQGLERWLFDNEFEIRHAMKSVHRTHTFAIDGIKATQVRRRASLQAAGINPGDGVLHTGWSTVDHHRASAACAFEQFRARAWVLGEFYSSLASDCRQLWQVTFVDTSDRQPEGNLKAFSLATYLRRIKRALANLKRTNPNLWAFGIVEISATRDPDNETVFEPHCHLLVGNASDADLRESFGAALKTKSSALRPLQLKTVSTGADLRRILGYFLKLVPELRTRIQGDIGRPIKGRANHLRGAPADEWLAWMAAHRISDLLIVAGLSANSMRHFESCDLQPIIEKLLRGHVKHAAP